MTTRQFIEQVLRDDTRKEQCSSVFRSGDTVYSYGYHYPLVRIINHHAFVNNSGYSVTTSKHIGWAFSAASNVVGWANTYGVPLSNGDSLTEQGILSSAKRELARLEKVMATKKRKNTAVFADLQNQHDKMTEVVNVIARGA